MDAAPSATQSVSNDVVLRFAICFLALGAFGSAAHADPLLTVEEVRWTNVVSDGQYAESYDTTAPVQPLYLWMRAAGSAATLEHLRAAGKLPIRHLWFKATGAALRYEQSTDVINLDIGSPEVLKPLTRELDNRGFFDWRTWSMKEHMSQGWWLVKLQYADGTPVLCGDDHHRCEFGINIAE
jgi:hypothetical protein